MSLTQGRHVVLARCTLRSQQHQAPLAMCRATLHSDRHKYIHIQLGPSTSHSSAVLQVVREFLGFGPVKIHDNTFPTLSEYYVEVSKEIQQGSSANLSATTVKSLIQSPQVQTQHLCLNMAMACMCDVVHWALLDLVSKIAATCDEVSSCVMDGMQCTARILLVEHVCRACFAVTKFCVDPSVAVSRLLQAHCLQLPRFVCRCQPWTGCGPQMVTPR
jgi:hypothetical protein